MGVVEFVLGTEVAGIWFGRGLAPLSPLPQAARSNVSEKGTASPSRGPRPARCLLACIWLGCQSDLVDVADVMTSEPRIS